MSKYVNPLPDGQYAYDRCDLPTFTPSQVAAAINAAYTWIGRAPMNDAQLAAAFRAKANLGPVLYFLGYTEEELV